jgi:hypothetical protein
VGSSGRNGFGGCAGFNGAVIRDIESDECIRLPVDRQLREQFVVPIANRGLYPEIGDDVSRTSHEIVQDAIDVPSIEPHGPLPPRRFGWLLTWWTHTAGKARDGRCG